MQLKTPLKMIHKNLLLTKTGDVWAYYRIKPESINLHNEEDQEKAKEKVRYFVEQIKKYQDFHFQLYPRDMNIRERFAEIEKDFAENTKTIGRYYNNETISMLESELGLITNEDYIVGVKLKQTIWNENVKEMVAQSFKNVTEKMLTMLGYMPEIDEEYFLKYQDIEKELRQIMHIINGAPLTEEENVYVNRHHFVRGIEHSVEEQKKRNDSYSITDSILDPTEPGYIKVTSIEGSSYISFIPVTNMPVNIRYAHLFQMAQNLIFPVELHIKSSFYDLDKIKGKTERTKRRLKETTREAHLTGDQASDSIQTGRYVLERLQNDIEREVPVLKWLAVFAVTGKTKEECKRNGDSLIRILEQRKIQAVRPIADQLTLFYQLLHGEPLISERNWIQQTNPAGFAENLFGVTNRLGNAVGFYIARVDNLKNAIDLETSIHSSRKIVLFHPTIANKGIKGAKTDSPHIAVTGETGKGKSFLVKLLFMYLSFLNTKLLYIDPKKEMRKWFYEVINDPVMCEKYPLFVNHLKSVHYITLDAKDENNNGVLDPIVFLENEVEAKDTAQAIIEQIYDTSGKDIVKTAILKAITKVISDKQQGEKVGMLHVIELLKTDSEKEVRGAGDLLEQLVKDSILRLAFSDGKGQALNLHKRINILEITGLDLPKENDDPQYYSDIEKKSVALMIPLGKFCEKFGSENPSEDTAEIFDEAWIFNVAKGGKKILKSMKRVGRSANNMLIYATQSVLDVNEEDDHGNFGTVFAFDERSERKEILEHMGIRDTEENREWLGEMIKGQCLFRDIYGRVGKIAIHCPFEEFRAAFATNKKNHSANAEELYR